MDMSAFNEDIKKAEDNPTNADDGPRYPDGQYVMAMTEWEWKNKFPIPNTEPLDHRQIGIWATFKIVEGEFKGKDFKKYYGMRHPDSAACVRYGQSGVKKLYRATLGRMAADFNEVFGLRFIATLESTRNDGNDDFPWNTEVVDYAKYTPPASIQNVVAETLPGAQEVQPTGNIGQPAGKVAAPGKWQATNEIDEIPF